MKTAVEWLENEFQEIFKEWGGLDTNWLKRFEQAKAMEKEQIINAYQNGDNNGADRIYYHSDRDDKSAQQYYNETFKSE